MSNDDVDAFCCRDFRNFAIWARSVSTVCVRDHRYFGIITAIFATKLFYIGLTVDTIRFYDRYLFRKTKSAICLPVQPKNVIPRAFVLSENESTGVLSIFKRESSSALSRASSAPNRNSSTVYVEPPVRPSLGLLLRLEVELPSPPSIESLLWLDV
jgi:hypothetical protein